MQLARRAILEGLDRLVVGPLSSDDALGLLRREQPEFGRDRLSEVVERSYGNPLALSVLGRSPAFEALSTRPPLR